MQLFTVGYGNWTLDELAARITEMDAVLVDIRYSPTSRNPSWRQPALRAKLGRRYIYLPDFGNVNYKGGPIVIHGFDSGARKLRALLAEHNVVLMCVCRDYNRCHRKTVVEMLQAAQVPEALEAQELPKVQDMQMKLEL